MIDFVALSVLAPLFNAQPEHWTALPSKFTYKTLASVLYKYFNLLTALPVFMGD